MNKFRIWDKINKVWGFGHLKGLGLECLFKSETLLSIKEKGPEAVFGFWQPCAGVMDDKTEIYEGDIVACDIMNEFGSMQKGKGVIVFHGSGLGHFCVDTMHNSGGAFKITKVLGNMTETPELVKEIRNEVQ